MKLFYRTKTILFILTVPLFLEVTVSCWKCPKTEFKSYTNKTISLANLDNTGVAPVESSASSINKNAYGIRVKLYRERACNSQGNPPSLFISSTYASVKHECDPPTVFNPKDSIVSIKIITLKHIDHVYYINSDVSDLFKVYSNHSFSTITEFLKKEEWVLTSEEHLHKEIDLLLMRAPNLNSTHQYRVELKFSDGRLAVQETQSVELN